MEEAARRIGPMMGSMLAMSGTLAMAIYEKFGKDALPVITEAMSKSGVESGKAMRQMMPSADMKAFVEQLNMMGSMMDIGMEITESSDDSVHFQALKCPFCIEGTSRELCEALMSVDEKRVGTFLGQEVETKILKTVAAGDNKCEVIISKK